MKPDRRASEEQQRSMERELDAAIGYIFTHYPTLQRQAKEMGRGFPSSSGGAMGSGSSDPVGNLVVPDNCPEECEEFPCQHSRPRSDPAQQAQDWLTSVDEARALVLSVANRARALLPVENVERGRTNTVEVCVKCDQPAPRVHRIDGAPYCADTCYFQVYRARRKAAGE